MRHPQISAALALILLPAALPAQSWDEMKYVVALMAEAQALSFARGVEVCGFIGYDRDGRLAHSGPDPGEYAGCLIDWPDDITVTASYHTHGLYDPDYVAEMPSDQDMLSDQSLAVNGWVATPGGRLWYVDSARMETRQACARYCLATAPGYSKLGEGLVAKYYSFDALVARLDQ